MSQGGPNNVGSTPGVVDFITGNTGGAVGPDGANNITLVGAGTITVTGNAGTNTLTISDMDSSWSSISASTGMAVNKGYFCVSPGGALVLTLPAVSVQGDVIQIALDGATSWTIAQLAGQSIVCGNVTTTAGVTGSLISTQPGDSVRMICRVANTRWVVVSSVGSFLWT